jgi:DNA-directed RNA polymerase subunit delta
LGVGHVQGAIQQDVKQDLSVADVAYRILKQRREPMKYKDLVEQVLEHKGLRPGQNPAKMKARIHTEINIDSRFVNQGSGLCGLREWTVKPQSYKVLEVPAGGRLNPGERLRKELVAVTQPEEDENEEEPEDVDFPADDDEDEIIEPEELE